MMKEIKDYDESDYVNVHTLPLKPPQPQVPAEKAQRRPWHPVMWDNGPPPSTVHDEENDEYTQGKEYPHKQRIRNLRRLIADGKVKPTSETLIFFLCNKFAVSEEKQNKISV